MDELVNVAYRCNYASGILPTAVDLTIPLLWFSVRSQSHLFATMTGVRPNMHL